MASDGDVWHLVEARRDDGTPAMFRIRDLEPRPDQPRIFVVEMPYPVTGLSRLPDAASYRRAAQFEEQWLAPACAALGWTFVAQRTEDGSFFLYLYGSDDPLLLIEKLSPFDGSLGFYDEQDPQWDEYAALREILDQGRAMPADAPEPAPPVESWESVESWEPAEHTLAAIQPAPRKPAAKKPAAKKPAAKNPAARKPAAKNAATKPAARKPAAKNAATKPAAKNAATKPAAKNAATKSAAKKPAAKKPAAKKPAAKKSAAKKPAPKPARKRPR